MREKKKSNNSFRIKVTIYLAIHIVQHARCESLKNSKILYTGKMSEDTTYEINGDKADKSAVTLNEVEEEKERACPYKVSPASWHVSWLYNCSSRGHRSKNENPL